MLSNIHPADALLAYKAQIAEIEKLAKVAHSRLVAMGAGHHDGDLARANVIVADRETIDWRGIAETLKPSLRFPRDKWSDQMVEMVDGLTTIKPVTTVRVNAKPAA
jgi:hypothetical protein